MIDEDDHLLGVISATDLDAAMQDEHPAPITAAHLAHTPPRVHPHYPLDRAIQALGRAEEGGLPVVSDNDRTIVGWITQRDILTIYRRRLDDTDNTATR